MLFLISLPAFLARALFWIVLIFLVLAELDQHLYRDLLETIWSSFNRQAVFVLLGFHIAPFIFAIITHSSLTTGQHTRLWRNFKIKGSRLLPWRIKNVFFAGLEFNFILIFSSLLFLAIDRARSHSDIGDVLVEVFTFVPILGALFYGFLKIINLFGSDWVALHFD